jgi:hypothetical protein
MAIANGHHLRSRAGEDDLTDHIDSDTPRSGIATPKPDFEDKRLPGIMSSYFAQVGSGSSSRLPSGPLETPALGDQGRDPIPMHRREHVLSGSLLSGASGSFADSMSPQSFEPVPLLPHEQLESLHISSPQSRGENPYPTPPASKPPSLRKEGFKLPHSKASKARGEAESKRRGNSHSGSPSSPGHRRLLSHSLPAKARRSSLLYPLSAVLTASNAHVTQFSTPPDTAPTSPVRSSVSGGLLSYDRLKKLTDDAGLPREKSTPPTPTRALSNQTANSDGSGKSDSQPAKSSHLAVETGPTSNANGAAGAPVKAARGKLTLKFVEGRNIRRAKDPYLVAVFQRNELVSRGPRPEDEDEEVDDGYRSPAIAIPMSRTGSESGRPMAIPMKSRQSSSTSLTEQRDFRRQNQRSTTNPKWDAEGVL